MSVSPRNDSVPAWVLNASQKYADGTNALPLSGERAKILFRFARMKRRSIPTSGNHQPDGLALRQRDQGARPACRAIRCTAKILGGERRRRRGGAGHRHPGQNSERRPLQNRHKRVFIGKSGRLPAKNSSIRLCAGRPPYSYFTAAQTRATSS